MQSNPSPPSSEVISNLRSRLSRSALGGFGIAMSANALRLLNGVLLARVLGLAGFGAYSLAMSWADLLLVFSVLGLDRLLIREVAAGLVTSAWGPIRGLIAWARRVAFLVSSALAALLIVTTWLLSERIDPQVTSTLYVCALVIVTWPQLVVSTASMQGLHRVVTGKLLELIIRPGLLAVFLVAWILLAEIELESWTAMGLFVAAGILAMGVAQITLGSSVPEEVRQAPKEYRTSFWLKAMPSLTLVAGAGAILPRIGVLMLGSIDGAEMVGIYSVANRCVLLIGLAMMAVNAALMPVLSSLYAAGDMARLERAAMMGARAMLAVALPSAIGLVVFGEWVLGIFGDEYVAGWQALALLSGARLFNVASGSAGLLLVATGHERDLAKCLILGTLANIVLNAAFIPIWHVEGAAAATALSELLWNAALVFMVRRRIGIFATPIAFGRRRRDDGE